MARNHALSILQTAVHQLYAHGGAVVLRRLFSPVFASCGCFSRLMLDGSRDLHGRWGPSIMSVGVLV